MPDAVLITRPEPGASETATRIAAMDLIPFVAPLMDIRPIPGRWAPPDRIKAILLPSGNAAAPLPATYHHLKVLTVGAATAQRARNAGFTDVTSAEGDASALTALVRATFLPGRRGTLLLAAGRRQSLPLADSLRRAGYHVKRRTVYETIPAQRLPEAARAALRDERTRAVLFFSAETARLFTRLVRAGGFTERLSRLDALTIAPTAAMALEAGVWARIRVAARPNQDEILALLR